MNNDGFENIKEVQTLIFDTKSRIESLATIVEHLIETSLADYFSITEEDYHLFCSLFYPIDVGLTFGMKVKLLQKLLLKIDHEYLEKHPDFINSITRVRKLRNNFAHSMNPTNEDKKRVIGKKYFELDYIEDGEQKTKQFPLADIKNRFVDLEKIIDEMKAIHKKIVELKKDKIRKLQQ